MCLRQVPGFATKLRQTVSYLRVWGLLPWAGVAAVGAGEDYRVEFVGVDTSERLGRYRWKIERILAWLTGYRRLTIRYERHGEHFAGFLQLAAALTCWKKLAK